jgi:phosphoribosyl-ATP pyrophosphohydrolase
MHPQQKNPDMRNIQPINLQNEFEKSLAIEYGKDFMKFNKKDKELIFKKSIELHTETLFNENWNLLRKHFKNENEELIYYLLTLLYEISPFLLTESVKNIKSKEYKETIKNIILKGKKTIEWNQLTDTEKGELKTMILKTCFEGLTQGSMKILF